MAINQKLILFAVAAEHRMVFENQTAAGSASGLVIVICAAETTQSASDDNEVELFPGVVDVVAGGLVFPIAKPVPCLNHRPGVSVGPGVVAHPCIARVGVGSEGRRGHVEERRSGAQERAV